MPTKSSEANSEPNGLNGTVFIAMGTQGMRACLEMGDAILKNYLAVHDELAAFVHGRIEKDIELQQRLAACDNPTDAFQTCSTFMQEAALQYWEEMAKLRGVAVENGMSAMSKAAKGADQATSDS